MKLNISNKLAFVFLFLFIFLSLSNSRSQNTNDNGRSRKTIIENEKKYYLHTIDIDQTLADIALIYNVTKDTIIAENPKAIYGLRAGSVLKIPYVKPLTETALVSKPTGITIPESIKISGYVDAYYAYYSDSVGTNNYQKFPDVSPKSNVFGINIFQLTAQYAATKMRATGTLHYGDVAASAWSVDYNMIQEANVGVRLTKKIWLDAGLFKTHIGTEALMPKDNICSSLAVITFYEPWWQAGAKLSYAPNDKLLVCLHALNGYNIFIDNNKMKSYGMSLSYSFGEKGSLGYYNLIGDESADTRTQSHLRMLHNLVFNYQITKKIKLSAGGDYISQQHAGITDTNKTAVAFSGILTLKYQPDTAFAVYMRGETFSDNDGFLTGTMVDEDSKITGLKVSGFTLGLEYKPMTNAFIRLEGRDLIMDEKQKIFRTNGANKNNRMEVMVNIGFWF